MTPPQDQAIEQPLGPSNEDREEIARKQAFRALRQQREAQEAEKWALANEYVQTMNELHVLVPEERELRSTELLIRDYRQANRLLDLCTNVNSGLAPYSRLIGTLHVRKAVPENEEMVERSERVELEIFAENPDLMKMPLHARRFQELHEKFGARISPAGPWVQDKPGPK